MPVASIIFLILFFILSVVQLYFCFVENEKFRIITKPLCTFFLAFAVAFAIPESPIVYAGAFLGCIGDIYLINNKNHKDFAIGALFFIIGHLLYFSQLLILLPNKVPSYFYIIVPLILLFTTFGLYPFSKKNFKKCGLIGDFYFPFLILSIVMGIVFMVQTPGLNFNSFYMIGYIFFLISDAILTITTFIKDIKRRDFYIMLSYLLSQFFIAFFFMMII